MEHGYPIRGNELKLDDSNFETYHAVVTFFLEIMAAIKLYINPSYLIYFFL
jgi:hypothetical protein